MIKEIDRIQIQYKDGTSFTIGAWDIQNMKNISDTLALINTTLKFFKIVEE